MKSPVITLETEARRSPRIAEQNKANTMLSQSMRRFANSVFQEESENVTTSSPKGVVDTSSTTRKALFQMKTLGDGGEKFLEMNNRSKVYGLLF